MSISSLPLQANTFPYYFSREDILEHNARFDKPPIWCRTDLPTRQDEVFTTELISTENNDRGVVPLNRSAVEVLQTLVNRHYTARQAQMAQLLMLKPTPVAASSTTRRQEKKQGEEQLPMINVDFLTDFYALMYIDAPCICNNWIDKHGQQYAFSVMSQPFAAGKVGSAYLVVPTWRLQSVSTFIPQPSISPLQKQQQKRKETIQQVSPPQLTKHSGSAMSAAVTEESEQYHELTQPTKEVLNQSMLLIEPESLLPPRAVTGLSSSTSTLSADVVQSVIPISLVLKGIQNVEIKTYLSMRTASYTPELGNMNEAVRMNRFAVAKQPGQYTCFAVGSDNFANQTCLHYILNDILKDIIPNYIYQYDAFICTEENTTNAALNEDPKTPQPTSLPSSAANYTQKNKSVAPTHHQQRSIWLNPISGLWPSNTHSNASSSVSAATITPANASIETDPIDPPVKTGMGFSITELATEGDLADFFTRHASILQLQDCEEMLIQILRPLRVLKQPLYGFVHADLKSRNIFVSRNQQQSQLHSNPSVQAQKSKGKEKEDSHESKNSDKNTHSQLPSDIVYKIGDLDKSSIHYHGIRFYNNTWEVLTQWTPATFPVTTGVINALKSPNDRKNQYYQFGASFVGQYISFQPFTMFNQFGFYISYDIYTLFISLMLEPVFFKIYTEQQSATSRLARAWQFLWFDPADYASINLFIQQQHLQLQQLPLGTAQRNQLKEMRRITFINQVLVSLKVKLRVDIEEVYDLFDVQIPPSLLADQTLPPDFFSRPMTLSDDKHLCLSSCDNHGGSYYKWCRTNRYSKKSLPFITSTVYDWDYCTA